MLSDGVALLREAHGSQAVVLVTGANGVIGSEIARRLADDGAIVAGADTASEAAGPLQELASESGHSYHALDVTSPTGWERVVDEVLRTSGDLTALVNCAGVYEPQSFNQVTAQELRWHIDVNTLGPLLGMQAFARAARRGGSIVNVASTAALCGEPGAASYSASKWALRGLSRVASCELADAQIRVNCVLPGVVDSNMALKNDPADNDATVAATPLQRMATPADVAEVVAFLVSPGAGFLTGCELVVDGGFTSGPRFDRLQPKSRP